MQFMWCEHRDLSGIELTASGDHLLGGKPDPQVEQADQPDAVRPPDEAELLDGEKTEPSGWLFRLYFQRYICGHVASLVCCGQGSGVRWSREGSADFGTNTSRVAHNLGLTADNW
jgi:hypothetical protein